MKAWVALLLAWGLAAVPSGAAEPGTGPLRVVTLTTVLTEIAQEVGGGEVDVTGLVQPGVDPHTFNPSPADVRLVVDADLVLASGLNLESYLDRLVASVGPKGRVVTVGDGAPLVLSILRPGGVGETDPHWWHSIDNMRFAVELVRSEFARLRPGSKEEFARNARAYERRLEDLRTWVAQEVATLPAPRRQLVTSHDAFAYFGHDYGFVVHPINGLSSEGEADAKHLAALIDLIRGEKIRAIFAESTVNPRLVENLLDETGARLGDTLYGDGLGPPGSGAETYDSMYRHNVQAIVRGLSAP
jgi:zinc/manganese transport system substrate-binding protein